jgi:heat shock protein HslJ
MVLMACATGTEKKKTEGTPPQAPGTLRAAVPDAISGIDWYLAQIRKAEVITDLNRAKMRADDMGDWFTMRFEGEKVLGTAAPNSYNGPCKWGGDAGSPAAGSSLSFGLMLSTKMMAFKEPDALNEYTFFRYLDKVNRWALTAEGRLELYTVDGSGVETALVFSKQP